MKELSISEVRVGGLVRRDDVDQLVMHQPVHPLVSWHHVVDVVERLDADADVIPRNGRGTAVTVVAEILHQDDDRFRRRVAEEFLVEGQRVLERAGQVVGKIFVGFVVVDEIEIASAAGVEVLRLRCQRNGESERRDDRRAAHG